VGSIVTIYKAAGKITTRLLRAWLHRLLAALPPMEDCLPETIRRDSRCPATGDAVREILLSAVDSDLRLYIAFRSSAVPAGSSRVFFWLETGVALKRMRAAPSRTPLS